jgi:hypothetical protein
MEVENQKKEVDKDLTESRRYLGKAIWGATDRLDIYVKLGASDLKVYGREADFRGNDGMTYGAGVRFLVAQAEKPELEAFLDIQGLGFTSQGTVWTQKSQDNDFWWERYDNTYDWREVQFSFFGVWRRQIWQPYIGLSITNIWGDLNRDIYRIADDSAVYQGSAKDEFGENGIPEFVAGGDIFLGDTGRLSGELRFGQGQISFFVGLSELWH